MENNIGTSKSDKEPAPNIVPATKSHTGISPSTAPATKVTLELHQVLHLPRKVTLCNLIRMSGARGLPLQHHDENDTTKPQRRGPQKGETYTVTWLYCNFLNCDLILMWLNWCLTLLNCDLIELWLYRTAAAFGLDADEEKPSSSTQLQPHNGKLQKGPNFSILPSSFPYQMLVLFLAYFFEKRLLSN